MPKRGNMKFIGDGYARYVMHTDWGLWETVWSDAGLVVLEFPVAGEMDLQWPNIPLFAGNDLSSHLEKALKLYLKGVHTVFAVPLDLRNCTPFQKKVYQAACGLGYGETASYGDIARRIGKPGGARAVGQALSKNPLPLVVPCHRVLGADGALTGFGSGLNMKKALLLLESSAD